ncbi:MAG: tetratricopeptide repeat protein [Flavobacterium sp.]
MESNIKLQELLDNLEKDKDYDAIIILLSDDFLLSEKNLELYYTKGRALNLLAYYDESISCFERALTIDPHYIKGHMGISFAYKEMQEFSKAKNYAQKGIELDKENGVCYYALAVIYHEEGNLNLALENYNISLDKNPDYIPALYEKAGLLSELKKYEHAIVEYEKCIAVDADFSDAYAGLGFVNHMLSNFDKALEYYNTAIDIYDKEAHYFYNRALVYELKDKYVEALKDYNRYLNLASKFPHDFPEYNIRFAKAKIKELEIKIADVDISDISKIVNEIKSILLFDKPKLTHYTSLSAAKTMLIDSSKFRLSEGSYLNDTSEGRELYKFLSFHNSSWHTSETIPEIFTEKPFIGSFVSDSKHDDLTLWRMYGKEASAEADGCAITISRENFLRSIQSDINGHEDNSVNTHQSFTFYSVAYKIPDSSQFILPGNKDNEDKLNKVLATLAEKISKLDQQNQDKFQRAKEQLNEIAYLFKSSEYQYEHEIRLVISGIGFEKNIDVTRYPPKVYIELTGIASSIAKITLGPKVIRADEWAAAFNYCLKNSSNEAEIVISHLPFK